MCAHEQAFSAASNATGYDLVERERKCYLNQPIQAHLVAVFYLAMCIMHVQYKVKRKRCVPHKSNKGTQSPALSAHVQKKRTVQ